MLYFIGLAIVMSLVFGAICRMLHFNETIFGDNPTRNTINFLELPTI